MCIRDRAYSWYDTNNETGQKLYDYCLSLSNLVDGITPDLSLIHISKVLREDEKMVTERLQFFGGSTK